MRRASEGVEQAAAAEALYRNALRDYRAADYRNAQAGFITVIDRFQDAAAGDLGVRKWVLEAYLGLADSRMEQKRYRDARRVYRSYIGSPLVDQNGLPAVYRRAAEASQLLGRETKDMKDTQQAISLLDEMLHRFGSRKEAHQEIVKAQFTLGVLLLDQGDLRVKDGLYQDAAAHFRAAKDHFIGFSGGEVDGIGSDLLSSYLARCEYNLAMAHKEVGDFEAADKLLASAQTYYQELRDAWRTGRSDPEVDRDVYREAYFQDGVCWLQRQQPEYVRALFAFLQARKAFNQNKFDAKILIYIAQCYSHLESDEQAISAFNELLTQEANGDIDVQLEIEELVGAVLSGLSDYDADIQARVHFYIAQAYFRAADRGGVQSAGRLTAAIERYQRVQSVLGADRQNPLYYASQIGQARAALRSGEEEMGEQILTSLLRDTRLAGRDRQYAAQLLGRYYKDQGRFEKAIQAYAAMGGE